MIIITTHKGSDFDALASLVAASLLYPDSKPVLPKSINENLKAFLSIHKNLFHLYSPGDINPDEVDTLVVVDTNSWNRLEGMEALRDREQLDIIIWDHHSQGDIETQQKTIQETGATITLLVNEIRKRELNITPIQATLFLMGIYEDTGNLTFLSTQSADIYAAGFLLEKKADLHILSTFLRQAYGKKQKDILFQMIKKAQRKKISGFTISIVQMDISGRIQNLAMVLQMYREIVNVDAAFGIFKDVEQNRCMVIGRSSIDEINIGRLMRSVGGGGHPGAGSALLKAANIDAVESILTELISGNQHSSIVLSDIMSYPVVTVSDNATMEEVAMILRDKGFSGVPVVDSKDAVSGIISRRDFKKIRKSVHMQSSVKAFMSRDIITIPYDRSVMEASRLMIKYDIGRIPVMMDNKIVGIVTRSDAMIYFYDMLPD